MSQPGSDQNKKRSRSLEYCNKCQDRLISGTARYKIQKARPSGVNCLAPWNWVINKSIKGCSYIRPPHATHHRMKLLNC